MQKLILSGSIFFVFAAMISQEKYGQEPKNLCNKGHQLDWTLKNLLTFNRQRVMPTKNLTFEMEKLKFGFLWPLPSLELFFH